MYTENEIHTHTHHHEYTSTGISMVFIDADSTLVDIEGIDELARLKGVENQIAEMTNQAMNGAIPFEDVYFRRLEILKPRYDDLIKIGLLYRTHITHGAKEVIQTLHHDKKEVYILSGGFNPSITMLAETLGIPDSHVFTNEFIFDEKGIYCGVDTSTPFPLWTHAGKQDVIQFFKKQFPERSTAMIGDGYGDWEAGLQTNKNIHFGGHVHRQSVRTKADIIIDDKDFRVVLPYLY